MKRNGDVVWVSLPDKVSINDVNKFGLLVLISSEDREKLSIDDQVAAAADQLGVLPRHIEGGRITRDIAELDTADLEMLRHRLRVFDLNCAENKCRVSGRDYLPNGKEDWLCPKHQK